MVNAVSLIDGMDSEWITLIKEAKELGLSKENIREFLQQNEVVEYLLKVR
jgi:DNA-binding transcriptional MerR regulator